MSSRSLRRRFAFRQSHTGGQILVRVCAVLVAAVCLAFSIYVFMHGPGGS